MLGASTGQIWDNIYPNMINFSVGLMKRERKRGEKRGLSLTLEGQMPISNVQGSWCQKKKIQHFSHYRKDVDHDAKSRGSSFDKEHGFCMVLKCFSIDYLLVAKEKLVIILYTTGQYIDRMIKIKIFIEKQVDILCLRL